MSEQTQSTWYANFFTELPNEFWRRAARPEMTEADIAFLEHNLAPQPGARIIDVPCGSGRHSLALAARGYRVTGFDISGEAVEYARTAATKAQLDVAFEEADMRQVPRFGDYDMAICLGNSFGYLDLAGTREFVAALAGAVRPGGGLMVDFNATAESVLPGFDGAPRIMEAGDITVEATTEYDAAASIMISHYQFTRGAEELTGTVLHHVYTSGHLGDLLTDGGFTDVRRYGSTDGAPYSLGDGRLVLTARRR